MPSDAGYLTVTEVEMIALDVLGGNPEATAEFAELLREFLGRAAELIARTTGVEDIESFTQAVLDNLDEDSDGTGH